MTAINTTNNNVIDFQSRLKKSPLTNLSKGHNETPRAISRQMALSDGIKHILGVIFSATFGTRYVNWTIEKIAYEAGKPYSTTCRLLNQIETIGFIVQSGKGISKLERYQIYCTGMCDMEDEDELAKLIDLGLKKLKRKKLKPKTENSELTLIDESKLKTENSELTLTSERTTLTSESTALTSESNTYYKELYKNSLKTCRDPDDRPPGKRQKKNKPKFDQNSVQIKMSVLLFDLIRENNPNAKQPNFQKWGFEINKLIKQNYTPEQIEYVIRWSQNDSFWYKNILSTAKLRIQFDRLVLEIKPNKRKPTSQLTIEEKNHLAMLSAREKARKIYAGQGGV